MLSLVATLPVVPASGCPGASALNPICQAGSAAGGVATSAVSAMLAAIVSWVVQGASWLVVAVGSSLSSSTRIDLSAPWFNQEYRHMVGVACSLSVPILLAGVIQALLRQDLRSLARSMLIGLPLVFLGSFALTEVLSLSISATDQIAASFLNTGQLSDELSTLASELAQLDQSVPTLPTILVFVAAVMTFFGALAVWLELLIRSAAIYTVVLFAPVALAAQLWPGIAHWTRRLMETLAALILSKLVIVAVLSLALSEVTSGTGLDVVLGGTSLLLLASFAPFSLMKLIPLVETGAALHLEGLRHSATRSLRQTSRAALAMAAGASPVGELDPGRPGALSTGTGPSALPTAVAGGDASSPGPHEAGPAPDGIGQWPVGPEPATPEPAPASAKASAPPFLAATEQRIGAPDAGREAALDAPGAGPVPGRPRGRHVIERDDMGPVIRWLPATDASRDEGSGAP